MRSEVPWKRFAAGRHQSESVMRLWYLNPYAGGPGVGNAFRPYRLGRAIRDAGHEMTVVTAAFHHLLDKPESLAPDFDLDGVRYLALPTRAYTGNGLGRILSMVDYAREVGKLGRRVGRDLERPDAIVVSSPHPFAYPTAYLLARRLKCAIVFEVRDIWPLSLTEILGTSRLHPLVLICGIIQKFAYARSDLVASLLPGVDRHVQEVLGRGRPFVWVPNGVMGNDAPRVPEASNTAVAIAEQIRAWQAEGCVVGVFGGTIGPTTGVSLLVEAANIATRMSGGDRLRIVIFGKGPYQERVAAEARAIAGDVVRTFSSVAKDEAVALIAMADFGYAGCLPHDALYSYGTSLNKLMDYMQCGLPVVFPIRAYMDPVRESGAGIALDETTPDAVAEALVRLVNLDPADRRRLGQIGAQYARAHYDWNRIAGNYLVALEKVV